jgi:hypothetical protein
MGFQRPVEWVIRPGLGLGVLAFGALQHEVARYLGKPEEVCADKIGGRDTIAWYYWELGVTAHFDGEDDFRLGTLDVERDDATLFGRRLIGCTEHRIRELLDPHALGATEFHGVTPGNSIPLLAYTDQQLYLYFHNGLLNNIQWTPRIGADDRFIWPPRVDAPVGSDSDSS